MSAVKNAKSASSSFKSKMPSADAGSGPLTEADLPPTEDIRPDHVLRFVIYT